jgi:ribonuclease HI
MAEPRFLCRSCGEEFTLPRTTLERFPGWAPRRCPRCHDGVPPARAASSQNIDNSHIIHTVDSALPPPDSHQAPPTSGTAVQPVTRSLEHALAEVLASFARGPRSGVFTDGGCSGNPGPGGWGAVWVQEDRILARRYGREPQTTNNRMELTALIAGYEMVKPDEEVTIRSDSELCVKTITLWAPKWERNGWRRKDGPVKNLDLVKQALAIARERPRARLEWVRGHDGTRWNEYVDVLSTR